MSTELVLLGTGGGPTPKLERGAPAHALRVDGATYVIDCGNGVARRLVQAGISLGSLSAVFVTHHHVDHNGDVGALLHAAWSQLEEPVRVIGPPPLGEVLHHFLAMQSYDIALRCADEGRRPLGDLIDDCEIHVGGAIYTDEHVRVTATAACHPPVDLALAYRLDTPDRAVVFSGDTRPTQAIVELARGADVLVHEAVYTPALEARARDFNAPGWLDHMLEGHTSAQDAGRIAAESNVGVLVLSPLFPADASVSDERWTVAARESHSGTIVVGRDLLVV